MPLGAAAVLFLNDHALKGAGLLPAWLTGKLSDVAGLFVFPVVVVACLRWAAALIGRGMARDPALAWGAAGLTGVLFAGVKLWPAMNGWAGAVLGPMSMDRWDLVALAALAPAGWWMSRRAARAPRGGTPALRAGAAAFAGLACVATSKVAEPPPEVPHAAAQVTKTAPCALVAPVTCRYDATRVVVRVSAKRHDSTSCAVGITQMYTESQEGRVSATFQGDAGVELGERDAALVGAYGRPGKSGGAWTSAAVMVGQQGQGPEGPVRFQKEVVVPCRPGFGEDTHPPAEVAR